MGKQRRTWQDALTRSNGVRRLAAEEKGSNERPVWPELTEVDKASKGKDNQRPRHARQATEAKQDKQGIYGTAGRSDGTGSWTLALSGNDSN